jgi:hypothetical protein
MIDIVKASDWDTLLVSIPFIFIMLAGIFRIDELLAAPKRKTARRRPECGFDEHGKPYLSDPDGRPWKQKWSPE